MHEDILNRISFFINEIFTMKKFFFFTSTILVFTLFAFSCKDQAKEDIRNKAIESVPVTPATSSSSPSPAPAANSSGQKHYACPNNCAGSGGDGAGTCPVCGTAYVHNQAFHNDNAGTPAATPNITPVPTPPPSTSEPAQNAAGVWHYTCSAGCDGGAGAAGSCSKCGGALAHNQAYH